MEKEEEGKEMKKERRVKGGRKEEVPKSVTQLPRVLGRQLTPQPLRLKGQQSSNQNLRGFFKIRK